MRSNSVEETISKAYDYYIAGNIDKAISCYREALSQDSNYAPIYLGLALIYGNMYIQNTNDKNLFIFAKKNYEKVLQLQPNLPKIHADLAYILSVKGDFEESAIHYKRALELGLNNAEIYYNAGAIISEINCDEAIEYQFKALDLEPDKAIIYHNLGYAYMAQKRVVEAEWYYKKAITLEPEYWEAYVNLANLYFLNKQYNKAWDHYEYRFLKNISIKNRLPNISKPIWDGSSLIGKTICVYCEQGLGDIINFIRYVPVLSKLGAKVILKLHRDYSSLEKLFKDSNLKAEILDHSLDDENIECDTLISVMSLPHRLKTTIDNIPYKDNYLKAKPEKVTYYKNKYFDNTDFKLGIVWNCRNKEVNDKYRSLNDLSYFYPFCKLANVQVYSLQKGDGVDDLNNLPDDINIIDLGYTFNDFSDTAAAIENLDLLISIDTSVPHLAGALGKPAWILLSYIHSWRWTYDLKISPWYNSIKLFRQEQQNVWAHPVQEAYEHFKSLIQSRKN